MTCGAAFEGTRRASYCSNACRQKAYRDRGAAMAAGEARFRAGTVNVHDAVTRAHQVAADISRASCQARGPLQASLRRIAVKIEDALRGEGL